MKLEVGEYYLSAGGEIVEIEYFDKSVYYDTSENYYEENGKCIGDCKEFDLIAHIPKQLHKHILNEVNEYYTNESFKKIVDSVWGINEDNIRI